jgi:hypothetical protein
MTQISPPPSLLAPSTLKDDSRDGHLMCTTSVDRGQLNLAREGRGLPGPATVYNYIYN